MDGTRIQLWEATAEMDAHVAEALRLMIMRLARLHGVELIELTVTPDTDADSV